MVCLGFVVSQATLVSYNWNNYEQFTLSDSYYLANQVSYEWKQGTPSLT